MGPKGFPTLGWNPSEASVEGGLIAVMAPCRLVLPEDAAEMRQAKATEVLIALDNCDDVCCICLDGNADAELPCRHKYHQACLESWFEQRPSCPTCGRFYGDPVGTTPDGSMSWSWRQVHLEGYANCSTIVLHFSFPSGSQGDQTYDGRSQHAYLPDDQESNA